VFRQRAWLRALSFLGLLGVAGWPWAAVEVGFSRAVSALGNVCLGSPHWGPAQLELVPLGVPSSHGSGDNVQADTQLVLRLPRPAREARLGLSLRRDAYLPLVIFAAATVVLPLPRRARLCCLALGIPLVLAVAILSLAVLALFLLGRVPGAGVATWQAELCQFLYEIWLTPPGNRVIAPLLLAAVLGLSVVGRADVQRHRREATTG
jgi:hypothetical protein